MAELQVNLPDSISEYADAQVASGRFPAIHDYLGALVSADEQAQRVIAQLSEDPKLAALLEEGLESAQGRGWSAAVMGELKQQVLDRAARSST
jgi:Arc/MetJ-type ribon-helix-helix transcriptional regulator